MTNIYNNDIMNGSQLGITRRQLVFEKSVGVL